MFVRWHEDYTTEQIMISNNQLIREKIPPNGTTRQKTSHENPSEVLRKLKARVVGPDGLKTKYIFIP